MIPSMAEIFHSWEHRDAQAEPGELAAHAARGVQGETQFGWSLVVLGI